MATRASKIPKGVPTPKNGTEVKKTTRKGTKANACGGCDTHVDNGVQCDACRKWHHVACTHNLEQEDYDYVKRRGGRVKWFCVVCDPTVKDILSNIERFKKMNLELKATREAIESKFKDLEKRLNKVENSNSVEQEKITKKIENIAAKTVSSNQVDFEEQQNIEKRKKNIIFFGIPETADDSIEVRLESDFAKVNEALDQNAVIKREEIDDIFRLGERNSTSGKHRPLLLKCQSEEVKMRVLKASNDLQLIIGNEVKPVFASNDMTRKQRDEYNKLRVELKRRKDNGENGIVIRGNKIVKLQFFLEKRANRTRNVWATLRTKRAEQEAANNVEEQPEEKEE